MKFSVEKAIALMRPIWMQNQQEISEFQNFDNNSREIMQTTAIKMPSTLVRCSIELWRRPASFCDIINGVACRTGRKHKNGHLTKKSESEPKWIASSFRSKTRDHFHFERSFFCVHVRFLILLKIKEKKIAWMLRRRCEKVLLARA